MAAPEQVCDHPKVVAYVESIGAVVAPHFNSPFQFRFRVVDDPSVNAFALPGGFVTVNMGLLQSAESGEEVAAVIGHELAHVVQRHGTRRVLRQLGGMAALSIVFGGTDLEVPATLLGGLANTAYDRDQETEADELGQEALIAAGVSPIGMVHFFERMAKDAALAPPQFLSTHPDPGNRAQRAQAAISNASATRQLESPRGLVCR
jgi:predicted Zn-dependent protease